MSMAPPGSITGTYYIILGNPPPRSNEAALDVLLPRPHAVEREANMVDHLIKIPKKKRGNDLKELAQQCGYAVTSAQVHPNLGCGYVSVEGQHAFHEVGKHLERQPWDGKNIQVDMRNEFNAVSLGPAPQAASPTRGGSAGQYPTSPNGTDMYPAIEVQYANYRPQSQAQVQTSPAYVMQNGYGQQYTYGNAALSYSTAPAMQVNYGSNRMVQVNTTQYQYDDPSHYQPAQVQQQTYLQANYPAGAQQAAFQQPAAKPERRTVLTSNRLLHVTRVSNCWTVDELEKRIAKVFGTKRSAVIEHAWIPSGTDKYALVLMKSEDLAATAVKNLGAVDGLKVTGKDGKKRSLKAKLAQEGISEGELAALKVEKNGPALVGQMDNLSMNGTQQGTNGTTEDTEETFDQSFGSYASSTTESSGTGQNAVPEADEIAGTGRRRSSLPVANGSFPQPPRKAAIEKIESKTSSWKDKERSSRHGTSHHSSSNGRTTTNGGSKKARK